MASTDAESESGDEKDSSESVTAQRLGDGRFLHTERVDGIQKRLSLSQLSTRQKIDIGLVVALLASGIFLYSLLPVEGGGPASDTPLPAEDGQDQTDVLNPPIVAERVHAEINDVRADFDLPQLSYDKELGVIAQRHSRDMANHSYVGRESPDGATIGDQYEAANYTCHIETEFFIHNEETNVMRMPVNTTNETRVAEQIVDEWMHMFNARERIKKPYWNNHGVGIYLTENDLLYATETFC